MSNKPHCHLSSCSFLDARHVDYGTTDCCETLGYRTAGEAFTVVFLLIVLGHNTRASLVSLVLLRLLHSCTDGSGELA